MTTTARKRSRASAKKAGADFERTIADYLAVHVDDRIDRKVRTGARDTGDIGGVRTPHGHRVVIECKNTAAANLAGHATEAETERVNDGALVAVVIQKRHGVSAPGSQWVHMTVADLAALLTGTRPAAHPVAPETPLDGLTLDPSRMVDPVSTDVDTPAPRAFTTNLIPEPDGLTPPGYTPTLTEQD